jgi:hypothetical protein
MPWASGQCSDLQSKRHHLAHVSSRLFTTKVFEARTQLRALETASCLLSSPRVWAGYPFKIITTLTWDSWNCPRFRRRSSRCHWGNPQLAVCCPGTPHLDSRKVRAENDRRALTPRWQAIPVAAIALLLCLIAEWLPIRSYNYGRCRSDRSERSRSDNILFQSFIPTFCLGMH